MGATHRQIIDLPEWKCVVFFTLPATRALEGHLTWCPSRALNLALCGACRRQAAGLPLRNQGHM